MLVEPDRYSCGTQQRDVLRPHQNQRRRGIERLLTVSAGFTTSKFARSAEAKTPVYYERIGVSRQQRAGHHGSGRSSAPREEDTAARRRSPVPWDALQYQIARGQPPGRGGVQCTTATMLRFSCGRHWHHCRHVGAVAPPSVVHVRWSGRTRRPRGPILQSRGTRRGTTVTRWRSTWLRRAQHVGSR